MSERDLREALATVARTLPPGASVSLPVDWIREQLEGPICDLTADEASEELGKSANTVRNWANRGLLPGAYRVGRSWRVPRSALEAVKDGKVETPPRRRAPDLSAWRKVSRET